MTVEATTTSMAVTFVGHATVLLEMDGVRLLTDPLLRRRIGVLLRHSPAPSPDVWRHVDAVLISHAHLDHLDVPSLRLVDKRATVVVPGGLQRMVRRLGFSDVVEMQVGETVALKGVHVTATPAYHSGTRHPMAGETGALGYVVTGGLSAYFAGDTGLFDGMRDLAPGLDLAMLPVGGWGPRLPDDHLGPLSAAKALTLLHPAACVPVHWGTLYAPWYPPQVNPKFAEWPRAFERYAAHLAPQVEVRILAPGGPRCSREARRCGHAPGEPGPRRERPCLRLRGCTNARHPPDSQSHHHRESEPRRSHASRE